MLNRVTLYRTLHILKGVAVSWVSRMGNRAWVA